LSEAKSGLPGATASYPMIRYFGVVLHKLKSKERLTTRNDAGAVAKVGAFVLV
jgi:hypothetical protein